MNINKENQMAAVRTDTVIAELEAIAKYRKKISPHMFHSNQSIAADLIIKEAKRIKKVLGE